MKAEKVKVSLKSGVTLVGELVEMDVNSHVKVLIGGLESVISMADIESVEMVDNTNMVSTPNTLNPSNLVSGEYAITDNKAYPDSFVVSLGLQDITMVLVRGGTFTMGFDGRHSMSWKTEPLHRVTLSSFYISKEYVNNGFVNSVFGWISNSDDFHKPKKIYNWKDVQRITDSISSRIGMAFRVPTEAEWEYVAIGPRANSILVFNHGANKSEWCFDYWGEYPAAHQYDTLGPIEGKNHVWRSFAKDNDKWHRCQGSNGITGSAFVRIAIKAEDYLKSLK